MSSQRYSLAFFIYPKYMLSDIKLVVRLNLYVKAYIYSRLTSRLTSRPTSRPQSDNFFLKQPKAQATALG